MSALPKTFEGTWDEVLKHANELAGHRLRVTVLEELPERHPAFDKSPEAIEKWVANLYEWAKNRPPVPTVLDDSRDSIYADRLDHQL